MAMCTTGNLSICSTAGTCRSISTAVGTGSGSLCALSVSAGCGSPHCMREFYGYNPTSLSASPSSASFAPLGGSCQITVTATAGLSWTVSENLSWITILNGSGTGSGSFFISASKNLDNCIGLVCILSSLPTCIISVNQGP